MSRAVKLFNIPNVSPPTAGASRISCYLDALIGDWWESVRSVTHRLRPLLHSLLAPYHKKLYIMEET